MYNMFVMWRQRGGLTEIICGCSSEGDHVKVRTLFHLTIHTQRLLRARETFVAPISFSPSSLDRQPLTNESPFFSGRCYRRVVLTPCH